MIVVNAPLKAQDIIDLMNAQDEYNFVEKKGMKLYFETTKADKVQAARDLKDLVKKQPWGMGLYFSAEAQ